MGLYTIGAYLRLSVKSRRKKHSVVKGLKKTVKVVIEYITLLKKFMQLPPLFDAIVYFPMLTVYFPMYTVFSKVYSNTVYFPKYAVYYLKYTVYCLKYTVYFPMYSYCIFQSILYII